MYFVESDHIWVTATLFVNNLKLIFGAHTWTWEANVDLFFKFDIICFPLLFLFFVQPLLVFVLDYSNIFYIFSSFSNVSLACSI